VTLPSAQKFVQEGKGMRATQTIQSPTPNHWEASYYGITLADLQDSSPLTLSDSFIPATPGDQTFAFQWDLSLGVGQNFTLNLTNSIGPISPLPPIEPFSPPILLTITRADENILLSWPTNGADGYQLESTSALPASTDWAAVSNSPAVVGRQYQVASPRADEARFYRLRK
jgi:hypothetical protein